MRKYKKIEDNLIHYSGGDKCMEASPMSLFENFIKEAYGSQYVIPVYQRNYSWRKHKQVRQLLEDIEKILLGESKRHFIGAMVYVIIKTDFIVRERAVVDGQQRLVTMFLIAHALRKISSDIGETEIANIISSSYLENSNAKSEYRFRLKPAVSDDDAYSLIAEQKFEELKGTDSKIYESYCYIENALKEYIKKFSLMAVINAIRELYVVRIELDENDNAQQIFESINSTGEKLTAADLIRNYIMMNKDNDKQETIYYAYWVELEKIFPESKSMEEYFRFYLAAKDYLLISIKDLYDSFKEYWKRKKEECTEKEILTDILVYAKHFYRLYKSKNVDVLGDDIEDFRKMQSYMPAPFAMEILELNRKKLVNDLQVKDIIRLLNTYLIRRYIAGQDTSAITRLFPTLLKNLIIIITKYGFENIVDICRYVLIDDTRQKSTFMPDDEQVTQYLSSTNAYVLQLTKWLFDKMENHQNAIKIDTSILSIEHIMPQTANDYWQEITGLSKDDYEAQVNKLGNLTLAAKSDNSKMQNFEFEYKKSILKSTGHLMINEPILKETSWTVEKIDKRTHDLIKRILYIFPYEKAKCDYSDKTINRHIFLNRAEIVSSGYLHEDQKVTIYAGSIVRYLTSPNGSYLKDLREDLLEKEIIMCENGIYKFTQEYTFNSPSAAADFIIGGSNNGWDYWKDIKGQSINDALRKLFNK